MNRKNINRNIAKLKRKYNGMTPLKKSGLNFRRRRVRIEREAVRSISLWAVQIAAVVLLAYLLTLAFGMRLVCSGESMTEAISENGSVLVDRARYHISNPKVGDVVAFYTSSNTSANVNIKRVVAKPGDTVLISNGKLYVNGEVTKLKNSDLSIEEEGLAETEITLGSDEYFVLGDNVNSSEDSRFSSVGNVSKKEIIGKVWFCLSFHGFGIVF